MEDKEIFDILGIEENNREKEEYKKLLGQFRELAKDHDKNSIWLKGDKDISCKGDVVAETDDLIVCKESLKEDAEEVEVEKEVEVEEPVEEEPKAEEPKLETFDEQMDFLAADEQEAIDGYEKVIALVEDEHVKAQLEKILVEEKAHKEFLEKVKEDKSLEYSHEEHEEEKEEEPKEDEIKMDAEVEVVDDIALDDIDDDFGFGEALEEDTVKKGNKWVNKGDEGTHGEFKTKKEADAQRKAMFANGYHEEVEEDFDDDFGFNHLVDEDEEEMGVKVDWNNLDDDEDAMFFKKVIQNADDDILDDHFGKDTPERKLVGAIKDMKEDNHEAHTGHIKAKEPVKLKAKF